MEDDDIILNLAAISNKSGRQPKISKTELKRMKYSQKIRENSKGSNKSVNAASQPSLFNNSQSSLFVNPALMSGLSERVNQSAQGFNNRRREPETQQPKTSRRQTSTSKPVRTVKTRNSSVIISNSISKPVNIAQLLPEQPQPNNKLDVNEIVHLQEITPKLKSSLLNSGVQKLTDIQQQSYAPVYHRIDAVIKAYTGSGKTLAYLIPVVNRILQQQLVTKREDGVAALIICPTRELCVQAQKQATRCLKRSPYIVTGSLYGGEQTNHQKSRLRKGTNILFCTPGRLLYHLKNTKSFNTANMKVLIFEQADRTLDMGFQATIEEVLQIVEDRIGALGHLQKILVSAHFNTKVSNLLEKLQMNSNCKFIGFENAQNPNEQQNEPEQMCLQRLQSTSSKNPIQQINTSKHLKQHYVLLSQNQKISLILAYTSLLKESGKILIFAATIDEVEFLDYLFNNLKFRDSNGRNTAISLLQNQQLQVYKLHGELTQKLRSETYLSFRKSKRAILISTEIASRGIDFPDLTHIILFDVPPTMTDYGNRVGRSARFNQTGVSLLMLHYQESDYAQKIRYYCPDLNPLDKDVIYEGFDQVLKSMNIGESSQYYLEGLVRGAVKDDDEKYQLARKAYVSMLRAYARLPDRNIFAVKKLNLKLLSRTFGLNSAQNDKKYTYNPKAKQSHFQATRKKRKTESINKLQYEQFM